MNKLEYLSVNLFTLTNQRPRISMLFFIRSIWSLCFDIRTSITCSRMYVRTGCLKSFVELNLWDDVHLEVPACVLNFGRNVQILSCEKTDGLFTNLGRERIGDGMKYRIAMFPPAYVASRELFLHVFVSLANWFRDR